MAGTLRLSNTGTGNGQSTITTAASGDTTYTLPSGGGTFVTTGSTQALTVPFASGTASAPSVTFIGDTNTGLYSPGADQVAISTGGTGRLFINSGGVVDISNTTIDKFTLSHPGFGIGTIGSDSTGSLLFKADEANTQANSLMQFKLDGSERMRLTSTGLGVGTSSPGNLLHVSGTSSTPATFERTGTTGTFVAFKDSTSLTFIGNTNGVFSIQTPGNSYSDKLVVTSAGNVGVGTTSPAAGFGTGIVSLDVVGPIFARGPIAASQTNAGVFQYTSNVTAIRSYGATAGTGEIVFNTGGGGGSADAERARIDSSGRLLVGTSTTGGISSARFQVAQTSNYCGEFTQYSNDAFGSYFFISKSRGTLGNQGLVQSGDEIGVIAFSASNGTTYNTAALIQVAVDGTPGTNDMPGRLVFSTTADGASSPTEQVRINNNGRVDFGDAPGTNADQNLSAGGNKLYISIGSSFGAIAISTNCGAFTTSYDHYRFFNGNGQVGAITTASSSTSYTTTSDYRLKENVIPVTDGITRLQQLKPSRFNFIADPAKTVDGFLAHEAAKVVPECVTGEKDAVDSDGSPIYQGIDQSKLVPLLTAALQEAIGRIETLEAEVAALKAQ